MTPENEQIHYAETQHSACCRLMGVSEKFDAQDDTLLESIITLKKELDAIKSGTEWQKSITSLQMSLWEQDIAEIRSIISNGGTAFDVAKYLDSEIP